jgi:hypothetical protein
VRGRVRIICIIVKGFHKSTIDVYIVNSTFIDIGPYNHPVFPWE